MNLTSTGRGGSSWGKQVTRSSARCFLLSYSLNAPFLCQLTHLDFKETGTVFPQPPETKTLHSDCKKKNINICAVTVSKLGIVGGEESILKSGVLTSYNDPQWYSNPLDFVQTIPVAEGKMYFVWKHFNTEPGCDYIQIVDENGRDLRGDSLPKYSKRYVLVVNFGKKCPKRGGGGWVISNPKKFIANLRKLTYSYEKSAM